MELLKAFIIERFTVAADEIFGAVEKTLAECQEEVDRMKEENARLQRLESKPEMKREPQNHGAEEEAPGQQLCEQEYRIILDQENPDTTLVKEENPETTLVKEEQEELWVTQEEEQLPGLDSDTEDLLLTSPCVRTDFDQVLPQPQSKIEPDRDGYGGPGTASDSLLFSVVNPGGVESSGLLHSVLKPLNPRRTERKKRQIFPISTKDRNTRELRELREPLTSYTGESSHRYMDSHMQEQRCECDACQKCFNQKDDLHHTNAHTGDGPHQCNGCAKCFDWENDLNRHMMTYSGAKPFKCKECGKCFKSKHYLNCHMRIHTGAKPFKCKECGKCFNMKHHLNDHVMIHTGDKPFKCKTCGKCFNRKYNLNCHMRIHMEKSVA